MEIKELVKDPKKNYIELLENVFIDPTPSWYFKMELERGTLNKTFPELFKLVGKIQRSDRHPEGDAFAHTMMVLDKVASATSDKITIFCALMHDIGKGETPKEMLPRHFFHDVKGEKVISGISWIPDRYRKPAMFVAKYHMCVYDINKPKKIVQMFEELADSGLSLSAFKIILDADKQDRIFKWWMNDEAIYEKIMSVPKSEDPTYEKRIKILLEMK